MGSDGWAYNMLPVGRWEWLGNIWGDNVRIINKTPICTSDKSGLCVFEFKQINYNSTTSYNTIKNDWSKSWYHWNQLINLDRAAALPALVYSGQYSVYGAGDAVKTTVPMAWCFSLTEWMNNEMRCYLLGGGIPTLNICNFFVSKNESLSMSLTWSVKEYNHGLTPMTSYSTDKQFWGGYVKRITIY